MTIPYLITHCNSSHLASMQCCVSGKHMYVYMCMCTHETESQREADYDRQTLIHLSKCTFIVLNISIFYENCC